MTSALQLQSYGATNEAEFFAVITGQFFEKPTELNSHYPDLYGILRDFYRQDPAQLELNSE
jgi:Mlc titration factor MtfA (ptsG expression regulator)